MNLVRMSISGAVMILAIVLIRALAIDHLPKKTFLALWGIALTRLLIPYSISSALSVYSLLGRLPSPAETQLFSANVPAVQQGALSVPAAGMEAAVSAPSGH